MLRTLIRKLQRDERGFTLIELMIVILVILILAAILLPQFGLAQERARKAKCVSNQRNLETAVAMWQTDNPNLSYVQGVFSAAATKPSYTALTGTPQYSVSGAFLEPDDPSSANQTGQDYYLYDGSAGAGNGGTASPEYGHATCAYQGKVDPWVNNANTAGAGTAYDHRRNPSYTP